MSIRPFVRMVEYWLLSPVFLALVVSTVIVCLLPDFFPHYRIRVIHHGPTERENSEIIWDDVDGDGKDEELQLFNNTLGKATIKITDQASRVRGHWIFNGIMPPRNMRVFSSDVDHDGKAEVFTFVQRNDSLFLQGVRFSARDTFFCRDVFLAPIKGERRIYDYSVTSCRFSDLDLDGTLEIIFTVMAGYPLQPRQLFVYNAVSGTLRTRNTDGAYFGIQEMTDLNGDRIPEILCSGYAIRNYPDSVTVSYHDSCAWLMVFKNDLSWFFSPLPFPGYTTNIKPQTVTRNGKTSIALVCTNRGTPVRPPALYLLDTDGTVRIRKQLDSGPASRSYGIIPSPDRSTLYLQGPDNTLARLDPELDTLELLDDEKSLLRDSYLSFRDSHGITDLISEDLGRGRLYIATQDLRAGTVADLPFRSGTSSRLSLVRTSGGRPDIYIQSGSQYARLAYDLNPFRFAKFPLWLGIYLAVLGFIVLIRRIQRLQDDRRRDAERKVTELQFLVLHNQLNPHFTFNAISSISASILNEKPREANRNLMALSRLMQSFVMGSATLTRSLAEELEFLENYLALMKGRLAGLEYNIMTGPGVDPEWHVPRMATQVYVENAIKHGLRPKEGEGRLSVLVLSSGPEAGSFTIIIEDDGIGRAEAAKRSRKGTGRGMLILDELYKNFNRLGKGKISAELSDILSDDGSVRGTRVTLIIPVDLKNRFS